MVNNSPSIKVWGERILLAFFFCAMGSLIYVVFSPLRPLLDKVDKAADYLGRIGLIFLLLAALLLVNKNQRFEKYKQLLLGLLIMSIAVSLDWVFSVYLMDHLGVDGSTPGSFTLLKLNECFIVVSVIIFITHISGGNLGSIYIQKGNVRLGLGIGLITFFLAAAGSIPMAGLFQARDLNISRILTWLPWLLIIVLVNAAQEELLFRGLFLRKLQPFFGKFISNFLIVFVFTLIHQSVTYTSNINLFLVIVFLLGMAWGYTMQRTNSIWGSILFHAGMDIPIFLGIFSNLT
jgi:uncharacterized protein